MIVQNYWSEWASSELAPGGHPRAALEGDLDVDVCIVGGGLTGLWTAYYLATADPSLSIAVLEKETVGFGASGRNGGWCSALFPRSAASLEREYGFSQAVAMRRAMIDTVAEVGAVVAAEHISCDFAQGGTLVYAMNSVQVAAARADVAEARHFGVDQLEYRDYVAGPGASSADYAASSPAAAQRSARETVAGDVADAAPAAFASSGHPAGALGATFDPACARLHPAKLVHGLAAVVEALGVAIYEHTEVTSWRPREATVATPRTSDSHVAAPTTAPASALALALGRADSRTSRETPGTRTTVRAEHIVIATEAYGAQLPGVGRRIMPLYSLMIATEPLPDAFWQQAGLPHGTTFSDYRHLLIYGQRTADNRFAFGGRGARYHWGSSIHSSYDQVQRVFDHLRNTLVDLYPDAFDAEITHRWGGPLGVARDWHASASYNPRTGVAFAGGYVGDGLSTTNLAGRTLTALITGSDASLLPHSNDLTRLPWVNHLSPRWEPEPLRFIGANLGLVSADLADREEWMTGRPSRTAKLLGPLTGH
ncbi:NAD(P)/FAD-dependent oxidoreductase [Subtercola lobariae]|uniref:FAD-dependent oxidoreductase n=1 Tax=Subtercola lobariae TaxID=1588641 RepID=A0A917B800_9MICO|nr:FAD-dependent oxidoreductase [Subtercola lobariae]GGF25530.1 FAD-dependent oxidoreductase [Subtercola lobariae]